ncbi:hypothetical protein Rhe02_15260 [Rhizocola hellebori]|uniref:DUF3617 family protein n=1 Tax=Rhizocola hellebori TaxID=1392758 RepID=A0A8J3VDD1_9ACTN|nr:hypothetical protein [Rhizocola hellebori]GIH03459.1 hypothetical protein Rhe02_15260 [Rhizocola hellebori]
MARSGVMLRRIVMATVVVIAASVASVAVPTGATAGPDISGTWQSVDREGVPQTMTLVHSPDQKAYRIQAESPKFAACGGMEASASGIGTMSADDRSLVAELQVTCMVNRMPVCAFEAKTVFNFEGDGALRDEFASAWQRTAEPGKD